VSAKRGEFARQVSAKRGEFARPAWVSAFFFCEVFWRAYQATAYRPQATAYQATAYLLQATAYQATACLLQATALQATACLLQAAALHHHHRVAAEFRLDPILRLAAEAPGAEVPVALERVAHRSNFYPARPMPEVDSADSDVATCIWFLFRPSIL